MARPSKAFGSFGLDKIAFAEIVGDHAGLHDRAVEQVAGQHFEAGLFLHGLGIGLDDVGVLYLGLAHVLAHRLAVDGQRIGVAFAGFEQLAHDRRQAAGAIIFFPEVLSGRLHIDQQRNVVADFFPVLDCQLHPDVARDGIDVDRRVGRTADGRASDDGILERLAGENVGRPQIVVNEFDRAHARLIGDLRALAVGRRYRRAAGQRHAERLGERIHGRGRAHGVAMADRGRRRGHDVDEFLVIDLAGRVVFSRLPDYGAGAGALAFPPAIEHRPARQHDGGNVHTCRSHQTSRRGLVATGREHDAVKRITVKHFDQAKIGKVAIERGGRAFARFLNRMHREFEGNAPRRPNAGAHAFGKLDVMAVAGRKVRTGLRDADDRLAGGELLQSEAVIEIALEIKRRHAGIVGVVEPELRAQSTRARFR